MPAVPRTNAWNWSQNEGSAAAAAASGMISSAIRPKKPGSLKVSESSAAAPLYIERLVARCIQHILESEPSCCSPAAKVAGGTAESSWGGGTPHGRVVP